MVKKVIKAERLLQIVPQEVKLLFTIFNNIATDNIMLTGGCVRDLIMDLEVADYDFACKEKPEQIIKILQNNNIRAIPTGIKYGTITAIINNQSFEITTLRQDVKSDGRHPETDFVNEYYLDGQRRDFTINALYLNSQGYIYDYFNGVCDIKNNIVKFIGDPKTRITEDYLRILRFFRFSARFSQQVDQKSLLACHDLRSGLQNLSKDRIRNEIVKMLNASNANLQDIISIMERQNFRSQILSCEFNIAQLQKILKIENLLNVIVSSDLRLFCLLHNCNSFNSKLLQAISRELNLSNYQVRYFSNLDYMIKQSRSLVAKSNLKIFMDQIDKNLVRDFYLLVTSNSSPGQKEVLEMLKFIEDYEPPRFPVNGNDIMKVVNIENKRDIGIILSKIRTDWINSDFTLRKEELLNRYITLNSVY